MHAQTNLALIADDGVGHRLGEITLDRSDQRTTDAATQVYALEDALAAATPLGAELARHVAGLVKPGGDRLRCTCQPNGRARPTQGSSMHGHVCTRSDGQGGQHGASAAAGYSRCKCGSRIGRRPGGPPAGITDTRAHDGPRRRRRQPRPSGASQGARVCISLSLCLSVCVRGFGCV
jgi:hypothetical protein